MNSITGKGGSSAASDAADAQLASQQLATDEVRRQFDITQGNLQPFIDAGTGALPQVQQSATLGGLDQILGQIFNSENFQNLAGERQTALQGQLAAGGLTRSGTALQEAANIPTQLGFDIENLLSGRSSALAGVGQQTSTGLGQLGAQSSSNIANLITQGGQAQAQGILGGAQAEAAGAQNILGIGASLGSIFFSDPKLKENVEKISEIQDLSVYEWDWIPAAKKTVIGKCGTIGFMADEVLEKYPHHVSDYCGFMIIDYPSLYDELDAKNG